MLSICLKPHSQEILFSLLAHDELHKLILLHWFPNYANIRKAAKPLVVVDPTFQIMPDGTVKTSFLKPNSEDDMRSTILDVFTSIMVTPTSPSFNPDKDKDILVHSFYLDGTIAYVDKIN